MAGFLHLLKIMATFPHLGTTTSLVLYLLLNHGRSISERAFGDSNAKPNTFYITVTHSRHFPCTTFYNTTFYVQATNKFKDKRKHQI